jgi:hypothetical protein
MEREAFGLTRDEDVEHVNECLAQDLLRNVRSPDAIFACGGESRPPDQEVAAWDEEWD